MLNERGIKAVTPSALNTPAGPNYSPTVTPCNSPEGSPPRAQSPEPLFGLLSSGADLIRRKIVGDQHQQQQQKQRSSLSKQQQQKIMLSHLERRALRSLNLIEKVESIGLENIISAQRGLGAGIANRSSSPLSSGSLQSLHTSTNSIVDDIHFDRAQIKGVLHRGLKSPTPATPAAGAAAGGVAISTSSSTSAYNSDDSDDQGLVMKIKPAKSSTPTTSAAAQSQPTSMAGAATGAPGATASETRLKQMQRQKSRRQLKNGMASQRPDLGTIAGAGAGGGRVRPDLGRVSDNSGSKMTGKRDDVKAVQEEEAAPQSITQAFVGSVSSLLFGRKGGWL